MYIINLILFFTVFLLAVKRKSPIFLFFLIVYILQFTPLLIPGKYDIFWPVDKYMFQKNSEVSIYLNYILFFICSGFICSIILGPKYFEEPAKVDFFAQKKIPDFINFLLIILVVIVFLCIISDFLFLNGMDALFTILMATVFLNSYIKQRWFTIYFLSFLYFLYIIFQVSNADRNFIAPLITIFIFNATFLQTNVRSSVRTLFLLTLIMFLGVYISMYRNGVNFGFDVFLRYFVYNSWMAVVRPLLDMLVAEKLVETYLYGKSYFDLVLSFAPSFVYDLLGTEKPYVKDNPAFWYHVSGGGGMHAVGVAIKNFGLFGVFAQTLLLGVLILKLECLVKKHRSVALYALFVSVCIVLMKSIWYSLLDFTNMLTLWIVVFGFVKFAQVILPVKNSVSYAEK